MDVAVWLCGLGLGQYAPAFQDNAVDGEVLRELTADDLKDLGVTLVGHRRKLLAAITALGKEPSTLAQSAVSAASDATSPPIIDAERRQLTVMFCDIVGSTALSTQFDPEDLRELIGDYHRAVADTVRRFDGFVAKYMGDGVLIYFGYPRAHEDDAERAVRAGLAVIEAVARLTGSVTLRVRIGIATGLAVVGDLIGVGASEERGVVGGAPNLAARVQGLAEPNTVVIADATRRQVGGLFELADLGSQSLAGFAEPQRAWRVIGESGVASRFEALRSGTTPLVGRDEELDQLLRRWQQAKSGAGRMVLVSGEPGIGKSRLTATLSQHIENEPHTRLRYFCSPHDQDSALYPFIGRLERAAGFTRDDTAAMKLDKLETLLGDGAEPGDLSLIAEMLSLSGGERFPLLDLSPQRKKERTLAALLRQLQALARRQPVLMIFEDLHWIDPTSREVLDLTVAKITSLPVLLVATHRPEFQPPWVGGSQVTVLALNRLGRNEGATLVHRLAGNLGALPPDVVDEIVERTDGVPLFVEELTKAVIEAGADRGYGSISAVPSSSLAVPATLHASLLGRLDRLGPAAKTVAQVGAAIGRDFSYELVAAAAQLAEPDLHDALRRLVEAGLVFQRGMPPAAEYLFKHALVQDTAYSTLLRGPRQALHRRIAEALEKRFPDVVETRPEIVALHYGEAVMADKAITYWHLAGKMSATKSAMREATAQLRRGLALVEALSDLREQAERELDLQMALGPALYATKISNHPEIGRTYARAWELCRQVGDPSREFTALRGLMLHHLNLSEMEKAQHFAEEALRVAERLDDAARFVGGHMALGATLFWQGKLEPALAQFQRGFEMFDPNMQFPDWPGGHPGVSCQSFRMLISWMLGYPDRSLDQLGTTIRSAEARGHAFTLVQTLCYALLHIFRHEPSAVTDYAARALRVCEEHRIAGFQADALCALGWALSVSGETEKGLAQIALGVDISGLGTVVQHSLLTLQADAQLAIGKPDAALASAATGLERVEKMGGGPLEAELHRLRGEAMLAGAGTLSEAEAAIEKGIDVARGQKAKSWELRAATSLARLWREQGRRGEARELLAPVYGWFTEGFDTADLKEAKALLDELT